jgi:excinuclease UvrABC nuclease subunit
MPADYERIRDPGRAEHYVYRLLGPRGKVLYVGCSMNLELRLKDHGRNRQWWAKVSTEGPFDYFTARRRERELIEELQPPRNIEWTKRHRRGVPFYRLARA